MAARSPILLACLLAAGTASAGESGRGWRPAAGDKLPSYRHLWEKSPFTSPAPVKPVADPVGIADDWTLTGVSEIEGGYMISMARRDHSEETLILQPGLNRRYSAGRIDEIAPGAPGAFQVQRVEFTGNWRETEVFLSSAGQTGSIRFDEEALDPSAASPAKDQVSSPSPAAAPRLRVQPKPPAPAAGRSR